MNIDTILQAHGLSGGKYGVGSYIPSENINVTRLENREFKLDLGTDMRVDGLAIDINGDIFMCGYSTASGVRYFRKYHSNSDGTVNQIFNVAPANNPALVQVDVNNIPYYNHGGSIIKANATTGAQTASASGTYILNDEKDKFFRISATTCYIHDLAFAQLSSFALTAGVTYGTGVLKGGFLYIMHSNRYVEKWDINTGTRVWVTPSAIVNGQYQGAIATDGTYVFVTGYDSGTTAYVIHKLNASTGATIDTYNLGANSVSPPDYVIFGEFLYYTFAANTNSEGLLYKAKMADYSTVWKMPISQYSPQVSYPQVENRSVVIKHLINNVYGFMRVNTHYKIIK